LEAGEAQPSGWKLLHLKGEALRKVSIKDIHKGLEPNCCLQAMTLTLVFFYRQIARWWPKPSAGEARRPRHWP